MRVLEVVKTAWNTNASLQEWLPDKSFTVLTFAVQWNYTTTVKLVDNDSTFIVWEVRILATFMCTWWPMLGSAGICFSSNQRAGHHWFRWSHAQPGVNAPLAALAFDKLFSSVYRVSIWRDIRYGPMEGSEIIYAHVLAKESGLLSSKLKLSWIWIFSFIDLLELA